MFPCYLSFLLYLEVVMNEEKEERIAICNK